MKLKFWQFGLFLLALLVVSAGVAYAQRPNPVKRKHLESASKAPEAFWKPGTPLFAGVFGLDTSPVEIVSTPVAVLSTTIKVPNGNKAELIATFSGEVQYNGTFESNGVCIGYFQVDNTYLFPTESYLTNSYMSSDGATANVSMQGIGTVNKGNHTVYFVVYPSEDADGTCVVYNRTLTVTANVHK